MVARSLPQQKSRCQKKRKSVGFFFARPMIAVPTALEATVHHELG
jgi:hypothetical protein